MSERLHNWLWTMCQCHFVPHKNVQSDVLHGTVDYNGKKIKQQKHAEPPKVWDFETDNVLEIWNKILQDINAYKIEELKYSQQITKALGINAQNADHAFENYKRWKPENPNPIEQLAQQLNPILFSLAVKTSFDFESIEDLKFIQIQTKGGTLQRLEYWHQASDINHDSPVKIEHRR